MSKKKTNYISYELQRLEAYMEQLQNYLDKNAPDLMQDRTQVYMTARGGEMVKVIASVEQQMECWAKRLKELPVMLESINRLRQLVDDEPDKVEKRGGGDLPGIFKDKLLKPANPEIKADQPEPEENEPYTPLHDSDSEDNWEWGDEDEDQE